MPDLLPITTILTWLQINQKHNAIKLSLEAERLRRRRRFSEAIKVAQGATQIAQNDFDALGVTLLYLSAARFSSGLPDQQEQSVHDCTRAIRALSFHLRNLSLAQIMRAQIESEIDEKENRAIAIKHFSRAAETLQKLIKDSSEHQKHLDIVFYQKVIKSVTERIEQLHNLSTAEPSSKPPVQTKSRKKKEAPYEQPVPRAQDKPPINLPIQTKLVWPIDDIKGTELVPALGNTQFDYIDVSALSIYGRPYVIQPIGSIADGGGSVRLKLGQQYLTMQISDDPDRLVLVRGQNRLDRTNQTVVVARPAEHEAWVDDAESDVPYTHVHIIGADRQWTIQDESPLCIIGIVEAIMIASD